MYFRNIFLINDIRVLHVILNDGAVSSTEEQSGPAVGGEDPGGDQQPHNVPGDTMLPAR